MSFNRNMLHEATIDILNQEIDLLTTKNKLLEVENKKLLSENECLHDKEQIISLLQTKNTRLENLLQQSEINFNLQQANLALAKQEKTVLQACLEQSLETESKTLDEMVYDYNNTIFSHKHFAIIYEKIQAIQQTQINHNQTDLINLEKKLKKELENSLHDNPALQERLKNLEIFTHQIIAREQKEILSSLEKLQTEHQPIYLKHQLKEKIIAEQKLILAKPKTKLFYNTFYTLFSAKLLAAISLYSGLIEYAKGKTEAVGKLTGSIVGNTLGSIPLFGAVIGSVASFAIEEGVGMVKQHFQEKKINNTVNSIPTLKDAMKMAEFFARRLTQCYENNIANMEEEQITLAAKNCASTMYNFIKHGRLLNYKEQSNERKFKLLLSDLQEHKIFEKNVYIEDISSQELIIEPATRSRLSHSHSFYNDASLRMSTRSLSDKTELIAKQNSMTKDILSDELTSVKTELSKHADEISVYKNLVTKMQKQLETEHEELGKQKNITSELEKKLSLLLKGKQQQSISTAQPSLFHQSKPSKNKIANLFGKRSPSPIIVSDSGR